ncbi:MAG: DUF1295 domain-containing protein [Bacteroidia bacterium]
MLTQSLNSKSFSVLICCITYAIAVAIGWFSANYFDQQFQLITATLIADVMATTIVFIFSTAFRNSSLYDPYWSVAPPLIIWFWIYKTQTEFTLIDFLLLGVIVLWSLRLTVNWLRGWRGLSHEDWRYIQLREQNPKLYPVTNFAGIHLFPTLIVLICLIPCYYALQETHNEINFEIITGAIICITAIIISFIADEQMRSFRKNSNENESMENGLWKYSRHPNYLGEILFWWGIWIIAIGVNIKLYWTVFGCITLTLMFIFISIPMMEKRNLARRKNYSEVMERVPMLFKLF